MKKNIPKIWEREGNEKIHSHNSGKGIRGFHSWEWTGTGIPAHPWPIVGALRGPTCQGLLGLVSFPFPFPDILGNDSLWFPFPNCGNGFFSFPSCSRIMGMGFFSFPSQSWIVGMDFFIPFPFPNLTFHRRESKRELKFCERYQTFNIFSFLYIFYNNLYWGGKMSLLVSDWKDREFCSVLLQIVMLQRC